jgi:hypothetical protein
MFLDGEVDLMHHIGHGPAYVLLLLLFKDAQQSADGLALVPLLHVELLCDR